MKFLPQEVEEIIDDIFPQEIEKMIWDKKEEMELYELNKIRKKHHIKFQKPLNQIKRIILNYESDNMPFRQSPSMTNIIYFKQTQRRFCVLEIQICNCCGNFVNYANYSDDYKNSTKKHLCHCLRSPIIINFDAMKREKEVLNF